MPKFKNFLIEKLNTPKKPRTNFPVLEESILTGFNKILTRKETIKAIVEDGVTRVIAYTLCFFCLRKIAETIPSATKANDEQMVKCLAEVLIGGVRGKNTTR